MEKNSSKEKKNRFQKSVSNLIIKNYIFFTAILFVLLFIIVTAGIFYYNKTNNELRIINKYKEYKSLLESGQYGEIPIQDIAGADAGFVILDKDKEIVYKKGNISTLDYRDINIELMLKPGYFVVENDHRYMEKYGQEVDIISFGRTNDSLYTNGLLQMEREGTFFVLDPNHQILYTTADTQQKSLSEMEYQLLTDQPVEGTYYRRLFFYQDQDKYTMVIHFTERPVYKAWKIITPFRLSLAIFAVVYVVMLILFSRRINRKVSVPIATMENHLSQYYTTRTYQPMNYRGLKEIENISRSYNYLFGQLEKEQNTSARLEKERKELVEGINHDIKTPITSIKGYLEAMKNQLITEAEKQQYLEILVQKVDQIDQLTRRLVEYNQFENNEMVLVKETVNISEFMRKFVIEYYEEFRLKDIEVEVDIPTEEINASIDVNQMHRVLDNLVGNSMKHNEGIFSLYFGLAQEKDQIKISVGDNGKGVAEEEQEDIFKPYYRSESALNKGSGLGLAVCRKIIQLHRGAIRLDDNGVKGYRTVFTITLPLE